jgi:hypothetical protein
MNKLRQHFQALCAGQLLRSTSNFADSGKSKTMMKKDLFAALPWHFLRQDFVIKNNNVGRKFREV